MTTVAQVLAEHDLDVPEDRLARELSALMGQAPPVRESSLTADEAGFLAARGGVGRASRRQLAALEARSAAVVVREAAESLSRGEVARQLGIADSRVSHRVAAGQLYAYPGAGRRPRFPSWQFVDRAVVPHVGEVVAALPADAHPASVRAYMTTPLDSLRLGGQAVSPVRWLASGGDPGPVVQSAGTLGEQV